MQNFAKCNILIRMHFHGFHFSGRMNAAIDHALRVSLLSPLFMSSNLRNINPLANFPLSWYFSANNSRQCSYLCRLCSFHHCLCSVCLCTYRDGSIVHHIAELAEDKDPLEVCSTVMNNDRGNLPYLFKFLLFIFFL